MSAETVMHITGTGFMTPEVARQPDDGSLRRFAGRTIATGLAVIAAAPGLAAANSYERPTKAEVNAHVETIKAAADSAKGRALMAENRQAEPHIVFGVADDDMLAGGDPTRAQAMLDGVYKTGARQVRMMIHPQDVFGHDLERFDQGIRAANAKGMGVNVTASLENVHWTKAKVAKYARILSARYGDNAPADLRIASVGFGNEAGFGEKRQTWIWNMPRLDTAETYDEVYSTGYSTIKRESPNLRVRFGDLSGLSNPIGFMHRVAVYHWSKHRKPLPIEEIAYHPYQQTSPPTKPSPHNQAGVGSMQRFEYEVKYEHAQGRIVTPGSNVPPKLAITEFSYEARRKKANNTDLTNTELTALGIPSKLFVRYLPERKRARWLEQSLSIFCKDPNIASVTHYGYGQPPEASQTSWNTPLVDALGKPLKSYWAFANFIKYHPECAITDPEQADATMEGPQLTPEPQNGEDETGEAVSDLYDAYSADTTAEPPAPAAIRSRGATSTATSSTGRAVPR